MESEELRVQLQWHEMELNAAGRLVQAREQALNMVIAEGREFYKYVKTKAEACAFEETRARNQRVTSKWQEQERFILSTELGRRCRSI
eukprot:2158855-Amphidinium_carterae.1